MARFYRYRNRSKYGYIPVTIFVEVPRRDSEGLIVDYDVRELTDTAIWRRAKKWLVTAEHRAKRWCKVWTSGVCESGHPIRYSYMKFTRATGGSLTSPEYDQFKIEYHVRRIEHLRRTGHHTFPEERLEILVELAEEFDVLHW